MVVAKEKGGRREKRCAAVQGSEIPQDNFFFFEASLTSLNYYYLQIPDKMIFMNESSNTFHSKAGEWKEHLPCMTLSS